MIPKTIEEKRLWEQGYRFVACVDEVGRGSLAGPVVAAAVCLTPILSLSKFTLNLDRLRIQFPYLTDSKQLSPKRREEIYEKVKQHPAIQWGIGIVSEKIIDKINIYQATKLAMRKAVLELEKKLKTANLPKNSHNTNLCYSKEMYYVDFLILDGNMKLENISIPQKAIVKGDEKVFSCALASIIAKVTRDRMILRYHKQYPQYGFDKHKGYGTRLHCAMLRLHGPCAIHRKTFGPVRSCKRNEDLLK